MSSHSGGAVVRLSSEASGRSRAKPGDYRSGFGAVDEARAFLGHLVTPFGRGESDTIAAHVIPGMQAEAARMVARLVNTDRKVT